MKFVITVVGFKGIFFLKNEKNYFNRIKKFISLPRINN